jgi:hypothetical protein
MDGTSRVGGLAGMSNRDPSAFLRENVAANDPLGGFATPGKLGGGSRTGMAADLRDGLGSGLGGGIGDETRGRMSNETPGGMFPGMTARTGGRMDRGAYGTTNSAVRDSGLTDYLGPFAYGASRSQGGACNSAVRDHGHIDYFGSFTRFQ